MAVRSKKCEICGEIFLTYRSDSKYCSDSCRMEANRLNNRHNRKRRTKEPIVNATLTDTVRAAREAGMSYGKYVAMKWLEGKK